MRKVKISNFYFFLIIILVSSIGASRNLMFHGDTPRYAYLFKYAVQNSEYPYWEEPLFAILVLIVANFTSSVRFYFGIIVFLVLILNFIIIRHLIELTTTKHNISQRSQILVALSCVVMSGWFYAGSVNGIKQYISILVLTLGVFYFWSRRNILGTALLIAAPLFHVSSILFLPILLFKNRSAQFTTCVFVLFALGYPLGINELLLKTLSDLLVVFGIPDIYNLLISYNDNDQSFRGFVPKFFVYTVFHFIILLFCYIFSDKQNKSLLYLMRIYAGFGVIYFIFGVGAWTNRLAFPSWSMIPFVYSILYFKISDDFKLLPRITLPLMPLGAIIVYSWSIYI